MDIGDQDIFPLTLPTPFPVGTVNLYIVKAERLTLIDTGPKIKRNWELFKQKLQKLGFHYSDIEQVILPIFILITLGCLIILTTNPRSKYLHMRKFSLGSVMIPTSLKKEVNFSKNYIVNLE